MGKYRGRADAAAAVLDEYYDAASGLWPSTGWWNAANALETTIDYALRTGSDTYRDVVRNTYLKNCTHDFLNEFYDDEGWWALAWLKAFDYTADAAYLAAAKAIFSDMALGWDATCGGGIWWNKAHAKKNAIANELFLTVAARLALLAQKSGDPAAGHYLDWAQRTWTWFAASGMLATDGLIHDGLTADCRSDDGVTWTYNQGVILGGLSALATATDNPALLQRAGEIAGAAIASLSTAQGILREPNEPDLGVDGPQFKGIFMRNLGVLQRATREASYRGFVLANADCIWAQNRADGCRLGGCWSGPFDRADASRQSAALDALNAALAFDLPVDAYQAEEGVLHGIGREAIHPGFHGAGYLAGWNLPGQGVDVTVRVNVAGAYDVTFRYAAYDDASRCVRIDGSVVAPNFVFAKTGSWDRWATATLYDVALTAGTNVVTVVFDAARGSSRWLNLDQLEVS